MSSSSYYQYIEVLFHLSKAGGLLPFAKSWRSSSIWVLLYSCKLTWSSLAKKCWKINFHGRVGGWVAGVAGSNENKANSAQFDWKLGLGLSLAIFWQPNKRDQVTGCISCLQYCYTTWLNWKYIIVKLPPQENPGSWLYFRVVTRRIITRIPLGYARAGVSLS